MRRGSGESGRQPGTAANTPTSTAPKQPDRRKVTASRLPLTSAGRIPVLYASAVYLANHGKVQHTVIVWHAACFQYHLHRCRDLSGDGHLRRAPCGQGRYRVIPTADVIHVPRAGAA